MKIVSRRRQRGLALIMMAVMVVLGATYIFISQLDSVGRRQEQEKTTQAALEEAKAALIGYAASRPTRPGGFPCPDTNNDGVAQATCGTANTRVGRLPWKTLAIADLRDASGERLWYALSSNFRNTAGVIINSDTSGQITLKAGTADLETAAIALVIAPGNPVQGQVRSSANENLVQMYLEGRNNYAADTGATNDDIFETAQTSQTFNDKVAVITHANLFSVVEAAVASRLASLAKYYIYDRTNPASSTTYFGKWGAFPFPATFSNPGSSTYLGIMNEREGLLPITAIQSLQWGTPTVSQIGGSGSYSSGSCTYTGTLIDCTLTYSGSPILQVRVTSPNVPLMFAKDPTSMSDITTTPPCGSVSGTSLTSVLNAAGYTVTYSGSAPNCGSNVNLNIKIVFPIVSPITSNVDPIADWFIANQWYKQTYYAVSPGYTPGGGGTCVAGGSPACLTVNNLTGTSNNKRAILILMGRSINGTARPSAVLANYLERQNGSILDYVFETNRPGGGVRKRWVQRSSKEAFCFIGAGWGRRILRQAVRPGQSF